MKNIVWFSCGASSAVMGAIVCKQIPDCNIVYCRVEDEHKDNLRFLADVEKWIGKDIEIIKSKKYLSVDDVIEKDKYFRSPNGAPCTRHLKVEVRLDYADVNDSHYWGFTVEEKSRIEKWDLRNPKIINYYPLQKYNINKDMCLGIIDKAGIELPEMYKQGFEHNNCIGCVKSASPKYWNMIRKYYPEVFWKRNEQSKKLKFKPIKKTINKELIYLFLDELDENDFTETDVDISCDIGCESVYADFKFNKL